MVQHHQEPHSALTRLRIDLAYDGTQFSGWAKQPGLRTVQGELTCAIAMIIRTDPELVSVTVAGRTDAGVHARGQVGHLDVNSDAYAQLAGRSGRIGDAARKMNGALKRLNATDIHVHAVCEAGRDFDARFSALSRRYEYRVRPLGVRRDPLLRHSTVDVAYEVDLDAVRSASDTFLGLQDFTSYCKAREGATAVRTLLEFSWQRLPDGVLVARIQADAFCHSMVRSLVGAVLSVGSGRLTLTELQQLTVDRSRSSRIAVMPPGGLSLEAIEYPEAELLAERASQTRARRAPLESDFS